MTRRAAGRGRGIPRIWLLPIVVLAGLLGLAVAGALSRSLLLDLMAWWPVWLVIAILVIAVRGRRVGRVRVSGLMPLVATVALGLFTWGHLVGWSVMPSSTRVLIGPGTGDIEAAVMSAQIDGEIQVSSGAGFLYEVEPVRRGGDIGLPSATEQSQQGSVSVSLTAPSDPGFYAFSGWEVILSAAVPWQLELDGLVNADLSELEVFGGRFSGEGTVTLADVRESTPLTVDGTFVIVAPPGFPIRIVGDATVPASWEQLSDGWRSPGVGEGWVVSVSEGSSLTVSETDR